MIYVGSLAMLNKMFAFSNAVSQRLLKNINKIFDLWWKKYWETENWKNASHRTHSKLTQWTTRHAKKIMTDVSDLFIGFPAVFKPSISGEWKYLQRFFSFQTHWLKWKCLTNVIVKGEESILIGLSFPVSSYSTHESKQYSRIEWGESCVSVFGFCTF